MACNVTLGLIYVHNSSLSYTSVANASACNCTNWHDDIEDVSEYMYIIDNLCTQVVAQTPFYIWVSDL